MSKTPSEIMLPLYEEYRRVSPLHDVDQEEAGERHHAAMRAILDSHASQLAAQGEQLARVVPFLQAIAELTEAGLPLTGRTIRDAARTFLTPAKAEAPREGKAWPRWYRHPDLNVGFAMRVLAPSGDAVCWSQSGGVNGTKCHADALRAVTGTGAIGWVEITHAEAIALIPAIAKDFPLPAEASEWGPEVVKVWRNKSGTVCVLKDDGKIHGTLCDGRPCEYSEAHHNTNSELIYTRPTPTAKGPSPSQPDAGSLEQIQNAAVTWWIHSPHDFPIQGLDELKRYLAEFAAQHAANTTRECRDLRELRKMDQTELNDQRAKLAAAERKADDLTAKCAELEERESNNWNEACHHRERAMSLRVQLSVANAALAAANKERDHWKANHDEMVARNAALRRRVDLQMAPVHLQVSDLQSKLEAANKRVETMERVIQTGLDVINVEDQNNWEQMKGPWNKYVEARHTLAQHAASLEARVKELEGVGDEAARFMGLRDSAVESWKKSEARATTAETALAAANKRVEAMERVIEGMERAVRFGAAAERVWTEAKSALAQLGGGK